MLRSTRDYTIAFSLLFGVSTSHAIDVTPQFDLQVNGVYRSLSQQGFSSASSDSLSDGLLFFGTQALATSDLLEFEIRHELRSVFGDTPALIPGDQSRLSVRSPTRFMRLERLLVENEKLEMVSDFERLRASVSFAAGEFWVGRRPISLGTLSFFKVWNKFTRPVAGLFGPTIVYGSDGFGGNYQLGDISLRGVSLYGPKVSDDAHLLEASIYSDFAELRFLGGRWWDNTAAGFAFSKTVFDWMLRFESLYLKQNSGEETQVGLGIDGAINSSLALLVETYFQSIGETDTSLYTITSPSRFTNMRARYYTFALLNWQMSTLWKSGFGDLINGVDGGHMLILRLNHSLSDSVEFISELNLPFAADGAEFSKKTFVFNDGNFLGSGKQFTAGLKATF